MAAPDPTLLQKFENQMRNTQLSVKNAIEWFKNNARLLATVNANVLMSRDRQRLVPTNSLKGTKYVGRMIMFFYQPKFRETLPFYDMFPLVIIIKPYPDGFLGLNLHYLPIGYRAQLLNGLHQIYQTKEYDENKKLQMSYQTLVSESRLKFYKPCIKRYLYVGNDYRGGGVTSRFSIVDPAEWDKMIALPVERFMKKTAAQAQSDSLSKLGIRKK